MKRLLIIPLLLALISPRMNSEPWMGVQLTITPGTAQRFVKNNVEALSLSIQMDSCSTCGIGYILYAPTSVTCSYQGAGTTLIAKLNPGTSTSLGGQITISGLSSPEGAILVGNYCVDGPSSAPVIVSWNIRN